MASAVGILKMEVEDALLLSILKDQIDSLEIMKEEGGLGFELTVVLKALEEVLSYNMTTDQRDHYEKTGEIL